MAQRCAFKLLIPESEEVPACAMQTVPDLVLLCRSELWLLVEAPSAERSQAYPLLAYRDAFRRMI